MKRMFAAVFLIVVLSCSSIFASPVKKAYTESISHHEEYHGMSFEIPDYFEYLDENDGMKAWYTKYKGDTASIVIGYQSYFPYDIRSSYVDDEIISAGGKPRSALYIDDFNGMKGLDFVSFEGKSDDKKLYCCFYVDGKKNKRWIALMLYSPTNKYSYQDDFVNMVLDVEFKR